MNYLSLLIIIASLLGIAAKMCFDYRILLYSKDTIFKGSGKPIEMAQMVLSVLQSSAQFVLGLIVICIISVLMIEKILETALGIPLISSIVGYLLGRGDRIVMPNISGTDQTT